MIHEQKINLNGNNDIRHQPCMAMWNVDVVTASGVELHPQPAPLNLSLSQRSAAQANCLHLRLPACMREWMGGRECWLGCFPRVAPLF